jgi:hypothetical protein
MNQYYTIQITGGTSTGLYSIYYNTIGVGNFAQLYPSLQIASGLTLTQLTSGTTIQVPIPTTSIYLYNESCNTYQEFIVTPPDTEYPCLCFTITKLSPTTTAQYDFCYSGITTNNKPEYSNASGYTAYWNTNGYWELSGYTENGGLTVFRSTYTDNIPDSNWLAYGVDSTNYVIQVQQGLCGELITPILLQLELNDPTCQNESNGSIIATASGGNGSFTYSLDNIVYLNNTGIFTGLSGGTYTVYVKDISGNTMNQSFVLNAPSITYFSIPANSTTQTELYTVGNMTYYLAQINYDTTAIPSGTTVTVNLEEVYSLTYNEPGNVLFDTSLITVLKNGIPVTLSSSATTPFSVTSPLACNPIYSNYIGTDIFYYNNITLQNGDSLIINLVYGVDVYTNGGFADSCPTTAIVNVTSVMNIVSYDCTCCEINNNTITENGLPIIYS